MAICPWAVQKLLPENETQAPIDPRAAIAHTAVDAKGDTRLWLYFGREDIRAETHFYITNDGTLYQMMDTNVEADANQIADKFAVSYETEDDGDPIGNPWTDEQLQTIVDLNVWLIETHPEIVPDIITDPRGSGLGWHSMWGFKDPLNTRGCQHNPWTNARCKTCPGSTRIKQFVSIVVPRVQEVVFGGDDVLLPEEREMLKEIHRTLVGRIQDSEFAHPGGDVHDLAFPILNMNSIVGNTLGEVERLRQSVATLSAELSRQVERGVREALAGVPAGKPLTAAQTKAIVDEVVTGELRKIFRQA